MSSFTIVAEAVVTIVVAALAEKLKGWIKKVLWVIFFVLVIGSAVLQIHETRKAETKDKEQSRQLDRISSELTSEQTINATAFSSINSRLDEIIAHPKSREQKEAAIQIKKELRKSLSPYAAPICLRVHGANSTTNVRESLCVNPHVPVDYRRGLPFELLLEIFQYGTRTFKGGSLYIWIDYGYAGPDFSVGPNCQPTHLNRMGRPVAAYECRLEPLQTNGQEENEAPKFSASFRDGGYINFELKEDGEPTISLGIVEVRLREPPTN